MNHLWDKDASSPCIVYGNHGVLAELRQKKAAYYQDRGYTCQVCYRGYKTPEDLYNHVTSTTCSGYSVQELEAFWSAQKPWNCPKCTKTFRTEDDRDSHFDAAHKTDTRRQIEYLNQKPFPCSRCPRRFTTEDGKDAHECYCGKTTEEIALEHEAWLAKEKPFVCGFCENRYCTEKRRNNHQLSCGNVGAWAGWSGDNQAVHAQAEEQPRSDQAEEQPSRDQAEEQPRSACTSGTASEQANGRAHQEAQENMPLECIDPKSFDPTCEVGTTHTASAAEQDKLEEIQPDVMRIAIQPDFLKDLKEIEDAEDAQIENAKVNAEVPRWSGSQSSSVLDAEWLGSQSSSVLDAENWGGL